MILALVGCMAQLDLGRATTLDVGETRVSAGSEVSFVRADQRPGEAAAVPVPWTQLFAGWHRGVADGWEVGARAWGFWVPATFATVGVAVDGKRQLHRARFKADPDVAIGASVWWHAPVLGGEAWHVGGLTVPVYLGYDVGRSQIVLTPRVLAAVEGSWGQAPLAGVGVGAGLAWDVPVGAHLHLVPEAAWTWSPLGFDGAIHDPDREGARNFETGLGLTWETW